MQNTRYFLFLWVILILIGTAAFIGCEQETTMPEEESGTTKQPTNVEIVQESGKTVYWVLPGKRRISKQVFGTPQNPQMGQQLLQLRIQEAGNLPDPLGTNVQQLLRDLPFLVALPETLREVNADSTAYTQTTVKLPFGNNQAKIVSGSLRVVYKDRQRYDQPGDPTQTLDSVDVSTQFQDPAGNEYEVKVKKVLQPPIPGYQTAGGVMTNAFHHGITGTGSPLMPEVYTYGAVWSIGDLYINGSLADENKLVHVMTTQVIRAADYQLALDEELPLALSNTIAGQPHHTHLMILPIKVTSQGPKMEPIKTAFTLPNGEKQPFIHVMFEQDSIANAPYEILAKPAW
ncbi:MAG TPA: hypothetical protein VKA68_10875 [bacterium]|nr:hypothetical protein [bacterium]